MLPVARAMWSIAARASVFRATNVPPRPLQTIAFEHCKESADAFRADAIAFKPPRTVVDRHTPLDAPQHVEHVKDRRTRSRNSVAEATAVRKVDDVVRGWHAGRQGNQDVRRIEGAMRNASVVHAPRELE